MSPADENGTEATALDRESLRRQVTGGMSMARWGRVAARALGVIVAAAGLSANLGLPSHIHWPMFIYFTIDSNALALVTFTLLLVGERVRAASFHRAAALLRGTTTVALIVTCLVYTFVLLPNILTMSHYRPLTLPDIIVHYLVPIWVVLDGFAWGPPGWTRKHDPWIWTGVPLAYSLGFVLRAALFPGPLPGTSARVPYYFMDWETLGVPVMVTVSVALVLAILGLGWGVRLWDRWRARRQEKEMRVQPDSNRRPTA
jgi:hypothetical protein